MANAQRTDSEGAKERRKPPTDRTPHAPPEPTSLDASLAVHHIPLDLIDQGEQLIRVDQADDEIIELAADIQAHGLLQPIGVRPTAGGRYQLLFGARRRLAFLRLRRPTIPATIHQADAGPVRAVAARENLLRRALTLEEECGVVADLHHAEGRSPDQIAALLSRSRAWVLRRLAIPNLPDDLREPLLTGGLSLGHAEALALLEHDGLRRYALTQTRAAALSVADCRSMVEALRADPSLGEAVDAGLAVAAHPADQPVIMTPCAACGTPRPLDQLRLVRLCADGPCATRSPDDPTT